MSPELLAHLYDVSRGALAEQERKVAALRGLLTPVLAAGGVALTLLSRPAFHDGHPAGLLATGSVIVGLVAIGVAAIAATYLLLADRFAFAIDASTVRAAARDGGLPEYYVSMMVVLDEHRLRNRCAIERLQSAFTVVVCGMLLGVCGLAVSAAVAS